VLDAFLRQHGSNDGGDFFLGGTYSYAETCTTGFVQRALAALPAFRSVDPWEVVRSNKLDRCGWV
jgi:glutathione S-transferase